MNKKNSDSHSGLATTNFICLSGRYFKRGIMMLEEKNICNRNFTPGPDYRAGNNAMTFLKQFRGFLLLLFMFFIVYSAGAVTKTSTGTGLWNTAATWSPSGVPAAGDEVIIASGHTVTLDVNTVNNLLSLTVNSGGTLSITGNRNIFATTFTIAGTFNYTGSGSINSTTININTGATFNSINGTGTITATTLNINGILTSASGNNFTVNVRNINLNHIFNYGSNKAFTTPYTMIVANAALYKHVLNGGTVPTATWQPGSTCELSNVTNSMPVGLNQTFYHFIWSSVQTGNINMPLEAVNGNFTISNGSGDDKLRLSNSNLIVAGNLIINNTNARIVIADNTSRMMTVNGNVSISSGAINFSRGSGTGTLNVKGNFTHTGGILTESSSGRGRVQFSGTASQLYTSGGTITNTVDFVVNSGSTLQMGTGANPAIISSGTNGTFTLQNDATLGVTSPLGITTTGATGNIQNTGTRTYSAGANYIYNGTANQVTGNGLTQNRPRNLTINNPNNIVTLSAATRIVGTINVTTNSTLNMANLALTTGSLTGSGTIRSNSAGSVTFITGTDDESTTFSGVITNGTGTVSFTKRGIGTLTLSGLNTYTGTTTLNGGTIRLGVNNALPSTSNIVVDNLTDIQTTPAIISSGDVNGNSTNSGTLALTTNATIELKTGSHSISFANSNEVSWQAYTTLLVTGWQGGFNGTTGTAGKIFFGNSAAGLTAGQLTQVFFQNGSSYHTATLLSTGELVPTATVSSLSLLSYPSPNFFLGTNVVNLVPTIVGTPTSYSVSPALPAGLSLNTTTGVISGSPTVSTAPTTYTVSATDGTITVKAGVKIETHIAGTYYARQSGNWNDPNTWSLVSGAGAATTTYPIQGDVVWIGDALSNGARTVTIPIDFEAACLTLNIGSNIGHSNALILQDRTTTLSVDGNITITRSSNDQVNSLTVNNGTVEVEGNVSIAGTANNAGRITRILIADGMLTIKGSLSLPTGASTANTQIDMSGGQGILNLAGAFNADGLATLNAGSAGSTFNYNGTVAQTVRIGVSSINYGNLTINNTSNAGATLSAAITATNVTGNLRVETGMLSNGGFAMVGAAAKELFVGDGATLRLTGTSTMATGFGTKIFEKESTVNYNGANQTVSNELYGNLMLSGSGTKTMPNTAMEIQGNFIMDGTATATALAALTVSEGVELKGSSTFNAGSFTHFVGGNWLRDGGTFNAGTGTVEMNSSALSPQTITGITTFNNLTIDNLSGVKANNDLNVNGVLNLASTNPNDTAGSLDMVIAYGNYSNVLTPEANLTSTNTQSHDILSSHILFMGPTATTIGVGDVTGRVKRNTIAANVEYTFGSQFTTMSFNNEGTLPSAIMFVITKGSDRGVHANKTNTVARLYQVIRTGGDLPNKFSIKFRYLDSELNGNLANDLVLWDHHIPYNSTNTPHEHGKTSQSVADGWVNLSGHGINYIAAAEVIGGFTKYWMISNTLIEGNKWLGAVENDWTNWNNPSNWTKGTVPTADDNVIIPETTYPPTLPISPAAVVKSITIENGAVLNGAPGTTLTIKGGIQNNGGIGSWINQGTFNASTSEVIFDFVRGANAETATISGATNFYSVRTTSGTFVEITSGAIVGIAGTLTNAGTIDAISSLNTVIYNGAGNQTIINPNGGITGYYNLTLSTTGTLSWPDPNNMNIRGNLINNKSGLTIPGTITLNGNVGQQLIGGDYPITFTNLTMNGSAGALLQKNQEISGVLTLTSGLISTNGNDLTASGTISGGSSVSYVNGKLTIPYSATGSKSFPIGKGGNYRPIVLNYLSRSCTGTSLVSAEQFELPLPGTLAPPTALWSNRHWLVTETGCDGTFSYSITLDGTGFIPYSPTSAKMLKSDGTTVSVHPVTTPNYTNLTPFTSFSYFGLGDDYCEGFGVTPSLTQPTCFSGGSITLSVSGGTAPYTYNWADLSGTNNPKDRLGLVPGSYSVVVTDANGCTWSSGNLVLNAPSGCVGITVCSNDLASVFSAPFDPEVTSWNWTLTRISGSPSTPAPVITSGHGTNTIVINWNNTPTGEFELCVNAQNVCGTSTNTCQTIYVNKAVAEAQAGPVCEGGILNLYASGGASYQWTGPDGFTSSSANPVIYNASYLLHNGLYTVTVTGASGCTATANVTVTVNPTPDVSGDVTNTACGQFTGAITLNVSGGSGTYTYLWSNGATTKDISNLAAGAYSVNVYDALSCSKQASFVVVDSNGPVVTGSKTDILCAGSNTGTATATVASPGTIAPYIMSGATGLPLPRIILRIPLPDLPRECIVWSYQTPTVARELHQ
jgi:autotransporter-associated beta strand protein